MVFIYLIQKREESNFLAPDLEGWGQIILGDYNTLTGYLLAHAWQQLKGPLEAGARLVPKIPFVVRGKF